MLEHVTVVAVDVLNITQIYTLEEANQSIIQLFGPNYVSRFAEVLVYSYIS